MFKGGQLKHQISEHFTGRSQWRQTCTVQTVWRQAKTKIVSAEGTSHKMYQQKRTLYDLNLI